MAEMVCNTNMHVDLLVCFFAAVADVFQRQTKARIMVGDPHQQIYGFRGAVNAMDMVQATCTFFLTQVIFFIQQ